MVSMLRSPSFLASCILAGVGLVFAVLAFTLAPAQVAAVVGGTAMAVGIVLARLRRGVAESGPAERMARIAARG